MPVRFARPNVADVMYHLYGRSVHPELFTFYRSAAIQRDAYQADVRIGEAGHLIVFRYGGQAIAEITAPRDQLLPKRKHLIERRLKGCRDEYFQFDCGVRYQVSCQLERLDPQVFLNLHEELVADTPRAIVACRFPSASRLDPGPISLICTDASRRSLLVHAFHTFPEDNAVVKTQSLFEI